MRKSGEWGSEWGPRTNIRIFFLLPFHFFFLSFSLLQSDHTHAHTCEAVLPHLARNFATPANFKKNLLATFKQLANSEVRSWSPAFKRGKKKFASNFFLSPLGKILLRVSVATLARRYITRSLSWACLVNAGLKFCWHVPPLPQNKKMRSNLPSFLPSFSWKVSSIFSLTFFFERPALTQYELSFHSQPILQLFFFENTVYGRSPLSHKKTPILFSRKEDVEMRRDSSPPPPEKKTFKGSSHQISISGLPRRLFWSLETC